MFDAAIYEDRTPPADAGLSAAARSNPDGWVYDIDFEYRPDESEPPESIRGAWEVSKSGELTGRYRKNPRYRPIIECDRNLKPYVHAAARSNPGKWIAELDPRGEELFPEVPDNLIVGWWFIGDSGEITRLFRPNSLYSIEGAGAVRPNEFPE